MIAARDPGAIERGDWQAVLGEVHISMHTYSMKPFLTQHPAPEAIIEGRERDLPEPSINPVTPAQLATRSDHVWFSRHNLDLETGGARSWRPRPQVLAVADLLVDERDGRLVVRTRDGAQVFDALRFFEYYLMAEAMNHFGVLPSGPRTPRVTVDKLVIERAKWRFTPDALGFAALDTPADRFQAARGFAAAHQLPRWVFARVPEENKPVYVDFESPLFVELLAKMARGASALTLSEMLPTVEECWLPGPPGLGPFASELRIACVDPLPWRP
jgi:hypothetical protein